MADQTKHRWLLRSWTILQAVLCSLLLAPLLFIALAATGDTHGVFQHLLDTVLLRYLLNTLVLMAGVGCVATIFGVSTAWLVSRYRFWGSKMLSWFLILPLAMPAYVIAYVYTDFLEYAGPVQGWLRGVFGWQSAKEYWFFEIRSSAGAIIIMAAVLYPYIYILARTAFQQTSQRLFEVARMSGQNMFVHVGLPLARPAIIAGLSLVLMEVLSDFGTVEYFGIETLTLGIFNVWLGMNSMAAAAQLALIAFVIVLALLIIERRARAGRSFENTAGSARGVPTKTLHGWRAALSFLWCAVPVCLGFLIPVAILGDFVLGGVDGEVLRQLPRLIAQSVFLAAGTSLLVVLVSLTIVIITVYEMGRFGKSLAGLSATGYAFPGTILALGVLYFATQLEAVWQAGWHLFGIANAPSLIMGTIGVLILGYLVRFQAVGYGAINAGIKHMPADMMSASRSLGRGFIASVGQVILPLLKPSMMAAILLVFVDVMKELPLTLLLRPFNFDTFATFTYQYANEEMLERAGLPALMIVLAGLLPVLLSNQYLLRSPDR